MNPKFILLTGAHAIERLDENQLWPSMADILIREGHARCYDTASEAQAAKDALPADTTWVGYQWFIESYEKIGGGVS